MIVGVPRESYPGERRVALVPAVVPTLARNAHNHETRLHRPLSLRGVPRAAHLTTAPISKNTPARS